MVFPLRFLWLPHDIDVCVSLDYNIQLEPWPDGQRKSELWGNINVELVLLFIRLQTLHRIQIVRVGLIEVRIGESNRSSFGKVISYFTRSHVHHPGLETVEALIFHTEALVVSVLHGLIGVISGAQSVRWGNKP